MVRSTLNSATEIDPVYSVYLKIFTNHIQIVGLISHIDFDWPTVIDKFQNSESELSQAQERLLSFDCLLQYRDPDPTMPVYYQKLLVYILLPVLLSLGALTFWLPVTFFQKRLNTFRSNYTSTLVILLFLVHPDLTETLLQSFNCIKVDDKVRLKMHLQSECYAGVHRYYMWTIVVPGLVVWAIGIPLFAWVLLFRNRNRIIGGDND